jgi:hypothetical protein
MTMRSCTSIRRIALLSLLGPIAVAATPSPASDPVGVYAIIDRVVITQSPATIQIWGVFALSTGVSGDSYRPAQRGYLYYRPSSDAQVSSAEWNDLRSVAGTGQAVGFGQRYQPTGRVRAPSESPSAPDAYPIGFGIVKMLSAHLGPEIARELQNIPLPLTPADGATVRAGQVTLTARNVADPDVRYVFSIDGMRQHEMSSPVAPGQAETSWTPKLALRAGEDYIWRVRVTKGEWGGQPVASSIHVVK